LLGVTAALFCPMPELAEVAFFRKQWDCGLGQKIIAVQLHPGKRIFRGTETRRIVSQLNGRRFLRSYARGKQMLFEFSAGNWIGIHLGMSGKLRTEPAGFRPEKHDHFVLQQTQQTLVLRDARLFGRVRFHHGRSEPEWWRVGGPDISSDKFDRGFLNTFLDRHARAPIKAVLLLQSGFVGIGNWMADEILWRAKIAPSLSASALSGAQRSRLLRETRFVASASLRIIGPDFSDPPPDWLIHQKWKREGVCPRHQSPLRKETIGGRTTAWCPRCQKS
jgi:formamidopyrimidine-DNA glycosylase